MQFAEQIVKIKLETISEIADGNFHSRELSVSDHICGTIIFISCYSPYLWVLNTLYMIWLWHYFKIINGNTALQIIKSGANSIITKLFRFMVTGNLYASTKIIAHGMTITISSKIKTFWNFQIVRIFMYTYYTQYLRKFYQ